MSEGYQSREAFLAELGTHKAEAAAGNDSLSMGPMVERLVRSTGSSWSEDALVGLVRGDHGEVIQENVVCELRFGFRTGERDAPLSSRRSRFPSKPNGIVSFVTLATSLGRFPLLRAVAAVGLPGVLARRNAGAPYGHATTSTGAWLDMLSSTLDSPPHSPRAEGPSTLIRAVVRHIDTPAAATLADLVAQHDPDHRDIDLLSGSPGHAVLMAALMGRRMAATSAPADQDPIIPPAPPRHRSRI